MMAEHQPGLDRLSDVLDGSEAPENDYRHDLAKPRDEARSLILAVRQTASSEAALPAELTSKADDLGKLIRDHPENAAAIASALADLRREVGVFVALEGATNSRADAEGIAALRKAAETSHASITLAAAEITRLLDGAQRLVGQYADDQLALHYRTRADSEGTAADK